MLYQMPITWKIEYSGLSGICYATSLLDVLEFPVNKLFRRNAHGRILVVAFCHQASEEIKQRLFVEYHNRQFNLPNQ